MRRLPRAVGIAVFTAINASTFVLAAPQPARAANCGLIAPSIQHCVSGISSFNLNAVADTQHTLVWCWAASAEMIFGYKGHRIDQADIVATVFGAAIPTTASPAAMRRMLSARYTDRDGNDFRVSYVPINATNGLYDIVAALDNDDPLLVVTSHHAMVLTGVEFNRNTANGFAQTTLAIVRDPWPDRFVWNRWTFTPGRRAMTAAEFYDIQGIARVIVRDV